MKVIIAGSRQLTIRSKDISRALHETWEEQLTEIVSGGCEGPDTNAEMYAIDRGIKTSGFDFYIPKWVWDQMGKKAGPLRNAAMAEYADAAIVFWDGKSRGTESMIGEMIKRKKPVEVYFFNETDQEWFNVKDY